MDKKRDETLRSRLSISANVIPLLQFSPEVSILRHSYVMTMLIFFFKLVREEMSSVYVEC